jgi:D-threonine aldolase
MASVSGLIVLCAVQVVAASKLARIARLARRAQLAVAVDSIGVVERLSAACAAADASVRVLADVNVGHNRCGVEPDERLLGLVRRVSELPGLVFGGLQCYHGKIQHVRSVDERRAAAHRVAAVARSAADMLAAAGFPCATITGGGTGSYWYDVEAGVFTEIQPGSYVFMDADYGRNAVASPACFRQSLFLLATVVSKSPGRIVLDSGMKSHSVDSGMPVPVLGCTGISFVNGGDEHGILLVDPALSEQGESQAVEVAKGTLEALQVGDLVRLIPGHCDPTVNMHDFLVVVREQVVEGVWSVAGRGPGA